MWTRLMTRLTENSGYKPVAPQAPKTEFEEIYDEVMAKLDIAPKIKPLPEIYNELMARFPKEKMPFSDEFVRFYRNPNLGNSLVLCSTESEESRKIGKSWKNLFDITAVAKKLYPTEEGGSYKSYTYFITQDTRQAEKLLDREKSQVKRSEANSSETPDGYKAALPWRVYEKDDKDRFWNRQDTMEPVPELSNNKYTIQARTATYT